MRGKGKRINESAKDTKLMIEKNIWKVYAKFSDIFMFQIRKKKRYTEKNNKKSKEKEEGKKEKRR